MKLIIDIEEDIYEDVKKTIISDEIFDEIVEAFRHGTPLPKGHRRLIDAEELLKRACVRKADEGDIFVSQYYCIEKSDLDNLQIIIEADNTGK